MKGLLRKTIKMILVLVAVTAALFLLGFVLTRGDCPVPKTVADDPSLPHVSINGALFHAETFGDPAKPVVIVDHGGPGITGACFPSRAFPTNIKLFYFKAGSPPRA